jgi:hypothetical protein
LTAADPLTKGVVGGALAPAETSPGVIERITVWRRRAHLVNALGRGTGAISSIPTAR